MSIVGKGIYNFKFHNIVYAINGSLSSVMGREYMTLGKLKQGENYVIETSMNKTGEVYRLTLISNLTSKGESYNFKRLDEKAVIMMDKDNVHRYQIYKNMFKKGELSISLNMRNFTMYINTSSYRNLINVSKDGSITCDKRNLKNN